MAIITKITDLLYKKHQYLNNGETLILVSNNKMQVLYNDDDELCLFSGDLREKLKGFIEEIKNED